MEFFEGFGGVGAEAGVDFGGLDDGAAGGGEPSEAGGEVEFADRAGVGTAGADEFKGPEIVFDLLDIEGVAKGQEPLFVEGYFSLQVFELLGIYNNADVEELFAFHPWDYPYNGVFK